MRHIMVMNSKGGCGKSTLATNLAAYYATEGATVALADFDPQRSALDWLDRRPADRAEIHGVAGFEDGLKHAPRGADVMIIDAPARSHGKELTALVRNAETIIVPVLPSTIDMQATTTFLEELTDLAKVKGTGSVISAIRQSLRTLLKSTMCSWPVWLWSAGGTAKKRLRTNARRPISPWICSSTSPVLCSAP